MGRAATAMVGMTAVTLIAVLALEYRNLQPDLAVAERAGPAPIAAIRASSPVADRTVAEASAHQAQILARPLFRADRRPAASPAEAASQAERLPRLTGILISAGVRSAIFASEGRPLVAREGGRIGAYLVQSIAPGEVTVYGPDGPTTLRPSFDAKGGIAPSADTRANPQAASGGLPPPPRSTGPSILDLLLRRAPTGVGVPGLPASSDPPAAVPPSLQTLLPQGPPP